MSTPIKVIIETRNGIARVHSNTDFEYVVIEYDPHSDEPVYIGHPTQPDVVDENLKLPDTNNADDVKHWEDQQ